MSIHLFIIRAAGSDLDGEDFTIQDACVISATARARDRVRDTFSLASAAMRAQARPEYVATFQSRQAYIKALADAEESGISLTPAMVDAVLDVAIGPELAKAKPRNTLRKVGT